MDEKKQKKIENKTEVKTESKAEVKTTEKKTEKFDFKAEAKKWWQNFVQFIKPYRNLDEKLLLKYFEPILKKHVSVIYTVGLGIILFLALYTLLFTPGIGGKFSGLVALLITFVLFRLTCELIANKK